MIRLYRVKGNSMLPTFKPGAMLLGSKWWPKPKVGQVVIVNMDKPYLKRITKINERGIWVEGDNKAQSTDSRYFGYLQPGDIEAVIFMRIW